MAGLEPAAGDGTFADRYQTARSPTERRHQYVNLYRSASYAITIFFVPDRPRDGGGTSLES